MKTYVKIPMLATLLAVAISSCNKEDKNEVIQQPLSQTVDASDPDAMSAALVISGAIRHQGELPTPTSMSTQNPKIKNGKGLQFSQEGGIVKLKFAFEPGADNHEYGGCFIQVRGAADYFKVKATNPSSAQAIAIELPKKLVGANFIIDFRAYDVNDVISEVSSSSVVLGSIHSSPSVLIPEPHLQEAYLEKRDSKKILNN
ncbi:hypothetical protein [Owenweeksia hongkongensis]|uniref:Lipoprotein n=1 Tax=Owenweeksia hongkongensis (strain DSM 17368 / CIP 108786 / JCM 12287 / NRRL B-23963 / UST20020801) TaxID=926562 RepID=G8R5X2_OWEHD|nr:hypothetical protein [Owenweeksia hongkongensis]AEV31120.1 hypothetical protein Oweho_0098 [Owenweeksia hongkongensis DSM 17368]